MRRYLIAALAITLAVLGFVVAIFATPVGATGPVTVNDLSALGYSLGLQGNLDGCSYIVVLSAPGHVFPDGQGPVLERNADPNHFDVCPTTDPVIVQQRVDALLAAWPPLPPATMTTISTEPITITSAVTTTAPAVTVTLPAVTLPAVTATVLESQTVTETNARTVTETVTVVARPSPNRERVDRIIVGEPKNVAPFTNPA